MSFSLIRNFQRMRTRDGGKWAYFCEFSLVFRLSILFVVLHNMKGVYLAETPEIETYAGAIYSY